MLLAAASERGAAVWHVIQGRMAVSGVDDVYGDDVLDRLLDLDLIDLEEPEPGRMRAVLTEAGRAALDWLRVTGSLPG